MCQNSTLLSICFLVVIVCEALKKVTKMMLGVVKCYIFLLFLTKKRSPVFGRRSKDAKIQNIRL